MTHIVPDGANKGYLDVIQKSEHHVPRFAAAIGSADDIVAAQDELHVLEVDLSLFQHSVAFDRVEPDVTDSVEQASDFVVGHGETRRSRESLFCRFPRRR